MLHKLADHCAELHRRHVHIMTVAIAVAASVGLYFVLPILLLAKEIAMSTPVIHRFHVAYAQDATTSSSAVITPPAPSSEGGGGPCPAGQYLGKTEKGELQCMFGAAPSAPTPGTEQQPTQTQNQAQTPIQVYPMPPGIKCQPGEVYTKNDQGKITCVRMGNTSGGGQGPQMGPGDQGPQMDEEFIDPREIKNVLNDIKKMKSQFKSFVTKLKKLKNVENDLAKISEMQTAIADYEKRIKNPSEDESIRDVMQEFYGNNYWDEINLIRAKVELPNELKDYAKQLTRSQKLANTKSFAKLGFDLGALKGRLAEMAASIKDVQDKYNSGDLEGANDMMQDVRELGHPGEVQGVMYQVRDITQRTKSMRSKDIQAQIQEIIQPVIDSFNEGEYRDANQALQEISGSLMKMQSQFMRMNTMDDATNEKLQKLQQIIEEKFGNQGGGAGEMMP